ncbi:MAG: FAD-dependent oxidoreductase [Streptosporangiales bacterium]|nr:FAD-dependent oxidoreductase [Streptosporangiales bacterium]
MSSGWALRTSSSLLISCRLALHSYDGCVGDVIVVGSGGAGVSAAVEAAARGASVIVVEAAAQVGGTASAAAGGTCVAGSPLQAELGIHDSPDRALADWLAWGGETAHAEWARRYLEASVPDVYAWLGELGVTWYEVRPHEGNSVPRWHAPRGGGRAVMRALTAHARGYDGIDWLTDTRATSLVTEAGRVTGVVVATPAGQRELRAAAVVVASGGFNNNETMLRRHSAAARSAPRILLGGGAGARGDGHRILADAGADFRHLDVVWMYAYATPDPDDPGSRRGLVLRGLDGDVWVDRRGHRFHNEARRGGATGTPALLAQESGTCWSVIDAGIAARFYVSDPAYRDGGTPLRDRLDRLLDISPFVVSGDDLAQVGRRAGIDGTQLRETVEDHNRARRSGLPADPHFGRPLRGLEPLDQPPFHAIQLFPLARKNLGGVHTDLDGRVLDRRGLAIPGLYAAGEVAGMAGGHINGAAALEGTMFGPSIFSGRVAGRSLAS